MSKKLKSFTDLSKKEIGKIRQYEYSDYSDYDENEDEVIAPNDFKYVTGSEKSVNARIIAQKNKDHKKASVNDFKKGEIKSYYNTDETHYDEIADEFEDVSDIQSPLDFNYSNSMIKNSSIAHQPVNSVFIGTALKQMEQRKLEIKRFEDLERELKSKQAIEKLKQERIKKEQENIARLSNLKTVTKKGETKSGMSGSADWNFGWSLIGRDYSSMTDYAVGIDYINKFHKANRTSAKAYVDNLFKTLSYNKAKTGIEGLGLAIIKADMSESDVQSSANALATVTRGKIPATVGAFLFALQNQAVSTPVTDFIVDNAVTNALVSAGETLINTTQATGSALNIVSQIIKFAPPILIIGAIYVAFKAYKKSPVGRVINAL